MTTAAAATSVQPATESLAFRIVARLIPFLLALAIVGAFCLRQIAEADLGWHMALGRVVAEKGIPHTNALCWTALNHPWFSNSWLYDWAVYELDARFGIGGVQAFMFVLLALAFAGVHAAALRLDDRFGGWVTPVLALLLIPRLTERPFVATWIALAWVLYLCLPEAGTDPDRFRVTFSRRIWSLPIIAICANLHQGALFAAIILGFFCAESFLLAGRRLRELLLAAAGVLALFANPGGMFGLIDSLQHVNVQSEVGLNEYFAPGLREGAPFFVLVALTLPIAVVSWKRSRALLATLLLFAGLGAWALRFMYDYELLAVPVLALGLRIIARRGGNRAAIAAIAILLMSLGALRWQWRVSLLLMGREWNRWSVPVDGAAFIRDEQLTGPMFNGYWEGGYLEGVMTDRLWFQDGRPHAFPPEFFQRAYATNDSPEAFRAWMRQLGVEWAITGHGRWLDGNELLHAPDWALVYWDDISEVFVRRDIPRFQDLIGRREFHLFTDVVDLVPAVARASRGDLAPWAEEVARVQQVVPDSPRVALARCALAARSGLPKDACDAALSLSPSPAARANIEAARALSPAP